MMVDWTMAALRGESAIAVTKLRSSFSSFTGRLFR
jgi:hypothetical protein